MMLANLNQQMYQVKLQGQFEVMDHSWKNPRIMEMFVNHFLNCLNKGSWELVSEIIAYILLSKALKVKKHLVLSA